MPYPAPQNNLPNIWQTPDPPPFLPLPQLEQLEASWREYVNAGAGRWRMYRTRYLLVFLLLRHTGARVSEVLALNDLPISRSGDIDYHKGEIYIQTLKRRNPFKRIVPVKHSILSEISLFQAEWPEMAGKAFKISRQDFWKVFQKICRKAGISKDLAHPHILRHSRAVELLANQVPLNAVQRILGHRNLASTAVYTQINDEVAAMILREKGLA